MIFACLSIYVVRTFVRHTSKCQISFQNKVSLHNQRVNYNLIGLKLATVCFMPHTNNFQKKKTSMEVTRALKIKTQGAHTNCVTTGDFEFSWKCMRILKRFGSFAMGICY